jgi:hypothetical protein
LVRLGNEGVPVVYGRLTLIPAGPAQRAAMEALADKAAARYRQFSVAWAPEPSTVQRRPG